MDEKRESERSGSVEASGTVDPAMLSQWLIEDLKARNVEIVEKDKVCLNLTSLGLVVLGAFLGLLAQNPRAFLFEWGPPLLLGLAVFFGFLGHQALYSALFSVISSNYIRDDLLPRIRKVLPRASVSPYGWERYLWNERRRSRVAMSALYISEGGVFVLPSLAFTAYAFYLLAHSVAMSVSPLVVSAILVVSLLWLLFAAMHTAWKLLGSEKTFYARKRPGQPDGH